MTVPSVEDARAVLSAVEAVTEGAMETLSECTAELERRVESQAKAAEVQRRAEAAFDREQTLENAEAVNDARHRAQSAELLVTKGAERLVQAEKSCSTAGEALERAQRDVPIAVHCEELGAIGRADVDRCNRFLIAVDALVDAAGAIDQAHTRAAEVASQLRAMGALAPPPNALERLVPLLAALANRGVLISHVVPGKFDSVLDAQFRDRATGLARHPGAFVDMILDIPTGGGSAQDESIAWAGELMAHRDLASAMFARDARHRARDEAAAAARPPAPPPPHPNPDAAIGLDNIPRRAVARLSDWMRGKADPPVPAQRVRDTAPVASARHGEDDRDDGGPLGFGRTR